MKYNERWEVGYQWQNPIVKRKKKQIAKIWVPPKARTIDRAEALYRAHLMAASPLLYTELLTILDRLHAIQELLSIDLSEDIQRIQTALDIARGEKPECSPSTYDAPLK